MDATTERGRGGIPGFTIEQRPASAVGLRRHCAPIVVYVVTWLAFCAMQILEFFNTIHPKETLNFDRSNVSFQYQADFASFAL
jgi:hypothetical protein